MGGENTKGKLMKGSVAASQTGGKSIPTPKVESTTPFTIFKRSIERARNLLRIHQIAHGSASRPEAFFADAHRAAVVLAVSALDAFVRTFVVTQITRKISDLNQRVPDKLRQQIKDYMGNDELFDAARAGDFMSRVEKTFREKFEEQSFQGVKKISEAMKLIGHDDIFKSIAKEASVNEENLKSELGKFTKRRHIIAHCGDYDLSQSPSLENKITKKDAEDCIKLVELLAAEINKFK